MSEERRGSEDRHFLSRCPFDLETNRACDPDIP